MNTKAFVLNKEDYDKKLAEAANIFVDKNSKQPLPYAEVGKKLYTTMGCSQCHSINGSRRARARPGRGFTSAMSSSRSPTCPATRSRQSDDDKKWDDYLRESILHPEAKIVQGFQNVMPSQESTFSGSPYKEKKLAGHHRVHQEPGRSQVLQADEDAGVAERRENHRAATLPNRKRRQDAGQPQAAGGRSLCRSAGGSAGRQVGDAIAGREEGARKMIAKSPEPDNYLTHSRGISSWIFTLDHKRIGVMYLISVLVALFLGGLFAMLIRTQLLDARGTALPQDRLPSRTRRSTSRTTRSSRSTARS